MLAAFDPKKFFQHCYLPLGDVMDIMAIGNSTINFIVYYFMSKQFRKTFLEMCGFNRCCPHACQRRRSSIANANNNDVSGYNEGKWKWLESDNFHLSFTKVSHNSLNWWQMLNTSVAHCSYLAWCRPSWNSEQFLWLTSTFIGIGLQMELAMLNTSWYLLSFT